MGIEGAGLHRHFFFLCRMHRREVQGPHGQRCVHELPGEHVLELHGGAERVGVHAVLRQRAGSGREYECLGLRVRVGVRVLLNKY